MDDNIFPYGKIDSTSQVGEAIRFRRKELQATQAKAAGFANVGLRFLSELERGKETAELAKTLKVLHRLGLEVSIVPRGWDKKQSEKADD